MSWYWWILIIIGVLVFLTLLLKIFKKEEVSELDRRLSGIKSAWDSVCAKIKRMWGC